MICNCGNEIHPKRVEILSTKKLPLICITCAEQKVERIHGFPLISGKNTYSELQLVSKEVAQNLYKSQERKGQSPGSGMRNGAN
jgi:hypothetical protein